MTILIVDDVPSNRLLLEKVIRSQWNCETAAASNGVEAFQEIKRQRPDLIFLDIVMPAMDGKEFLKHLRALDQGKTIPVVIMTSSSDLALVKELAVLGVSGYLLRPFSAEQVVQSVVKALKLDAKPEGSEGAPEGENKS